MEAENSGCLVMSRLCLSLTVCLWPCYINSPSLSFIVCKRGSQQRLLHKL